jgi:hypothetical protein
MAPHRSALVTACKCIAYLLVPSPTSAALLNTMKNEKKNILFLVVPVIVPNN